MFVGYKAHVRVFLSNKNMTSSTTFMQRIEMIVKNIGGRKALADAADLSIAVIDKYRKGESDPSRARLVAIADAANVSLEWLATGIGNPERGAAEELLMIPQVSAKLSAGVGEISDLVEVVNEVPFSMQMLSHLGRTHIEKLVIFKVRGDSMEPTAPDSSQALVDLADTQIVGGIYAIAVDGEARIKRLKKRVTGELEIISDNSFYETEVLSGEQLNIVQIIGRVRWLGRWL